MRTIQFCEGCLPLMSYDFLHFRLPMTQRLKIHTLANLIVYFFNFQIRELSDEEMLQDVVVQFE
jgi:hypothetical protein